jgi:hypothetical protein
MLVYSAVHTQERMECCVFSLLIYFPSDVSARRRTRDWEICLRAWNAATEVKYLSCVGANRERGP